MGAKRRRPGAAPRAEQTAVLGLLGALLSVWKTAAALLPNVEVVSLLILVYASVLGRRVFSAVLVFVVLEALLWGFSLWTLCYLYVWPLLALAGCLLRGMRPAWAWAALSGAFGLSFGGLCALLCLPLEGWRGVLACWVRGLPFDVIHCGGNFVLALALFQPVRAALARLAGRVFPGTAGEAGAAHTGRGPRV